MSFTYNLPSIISRKAIYPIYAAYKKTGFLSYYHELARTQWLPESEIRKIQWQKLKSLLSHSFDHVPYYRKAFGRLGITPDDIQSEQDFAGLPILTKKDVQSNLPDLISDAHDVKDLVQNASGGSTGEPTIFYQDQKRNDLRKGYVLRHDQWSGWNLGEKVAMIWGASRDLSEETDLKSRIHNFLMEKKIWLDAFDLSEEKIIAFARFLKKYRPSLIVGYSNALYTFFKVLKEHNENIPSPKGIISSAETLFPWQREQIESMSGAAIFNRYGSREVGLICSECSEHSGMHINAENVYVEIIKDGKPAAPGETGEVVVTDLMNYGMPFIRYNMEDLATFSGSSCDCGRGLPMIESILGRTSDMLFAPDGRLIHGEYFTHLFYGIAGVRKFQLIQKRDMGIVVEIEADKEMNEDKLSGLKSRIQDTLKSSDVLLKIVEKIHVPESGKRRFTISEGQAASYAKEFDPGLSRPPASEAGGKPSYPESTPLETPLHLYQSPLYRAGDGSWHRRFDEALNHTNTELTWDAATILSILSFAYPCGDHTLINEIRRRPWLSSIGTDKRPKLEKIPPHDTMSRSHDRIAGGLIRLVREEIVRACKGFKDVYIMLSGGLDSRIVAAITSRAAREGEIQSEPIAVTWGLADSRDVVYGEATAKILGLPWLHADLSPGDMQVNIQNAVNSLGCLIPGVHLHGTDWFKNVPKDALVLSSSYGDGVGRAEFSGGHILEIPYLEPADYYGLLNHDVLHDAHGLLTSTLRELHDRTPGQPGYVLCEHERQGHYMRGMIAHAMSIINDYCTVYQVFTAPETYSYMWAIHPSLRTDDVYARMLEKLDADLAELPWARTNRSLSGKRSRAVGSLRPAFHDYRHWISGELYEDLMSRIDFDFLEGTGIFRMESLGDFCRLVKTGTPEFRPYDIFVWLAGFCMFGRMLADSGRTVSLREPEAPLSRPDSFAAVHGGRPGRMGTWYRHQKKLYPFRKTKSILRKTRKILLLRRALKKYPPKTDPASMDRD
jgi:phenylacetate-coenzyme A ligase PaaK-like adenylate-forming protein